MNLTKIALMITIVLTIQKDLSRAKPLEENPVEISADKDLPEIFLIKNDGELINNQSILEKNGDDKKKDDKKEDVEEDVEEDSNIECWTAVINFILEFAFRFSREQRRTFNRG
jgi:hypothetical protein